MHGAYIHCGQQHLQRYLKEFAFRYNNRYGVGINNGERTARMMQGIEGKRLTLFQVSYLCAALVATVQGQP